MIYEEDKLIESEYLAKHCDGRELLLHIRIDIPKKETMQNGDYCCRFSVPELNIDNPIFGVDATQSLCLAILRFRSWVESMSSDGWTFYFSQDTDQEIDLLATYFPTQW